MNQTRIYHPQVITVSCDYELTPLASHHLLNVLRMRLENKLVLFDGSGSEYRAVIKKVTKKKRVMVYIEAPIAVKRESPLSIELGQGISRGDRMDYAIQKAVELGVSGITPLLTSRRQFKPNVERLQKKMLHWQGVIISASEQSGRLRIPLLNPPLPLKEWLAIKKTGLCLVCNTQKSVTLDSESPSQVTVLIGPESGLSDDEIQLANACNYKNFQLGPRILRTETAAVVALTRLQMQWGDL